MKILIYTQYFPPEVGAPQNRLFELAIRLQKYGAEIIVLTAMPNYPQMEIYHGYRRKFSYHEEIEGLKIYRSWIFVSKRKSVLFRLLNYFSFVWSSFWSGCLRLGKFDFIICESPPLFLGISAYLLKKIKKAKLIFNVSDLWPESAEKLGLVNNKLLLKSATKLEEFIYRNSELICGQTQGIVNNISSRFPDKKVYWLPNGVNLEYYKHDLVKSDWRNEKQIAADDFILLYAGIIGHAQGLEVILNAAELLRSYPKIKFVFLGDGPVKENLLEIAHNKNLSKVYFYSTEPKNRMPEIIKAIDVAIIPLKRIDIFKGAIPSKIFENLAMRKPILLGVEGEAKKMFIDDGKAGLSFIPEDEKDLCQKILNLYNDRELLFHLGENGYNYIKEKFTRDKIASDFWNFILSFKE